MSGWLWCLIGFCCGTGLTGGVLILAIGRNFDRGIWMNRHDAGDSHVHHGRG